jgi:hypothetical protein
MWKLLKQNTGRTPFEQLNQLRNRVSWFQFEHNVNMVYLSFDGYDIEFLLCGNIADYVFDSIANFVSQNASPVFRTPDKMVIQCMSAMRRTVAKLRHIFDLCVLFYHRMPIFTSGKRQSLESAIAVDTIPPPLKKTAVSL